ncbi:unnamed protein product [Protopolystoma xenopodis]|uniref:Uncharacterized protein n=1 Tax=Protopolystoma xenopodis TaxID=117903 RepID=A0A3S5BQ79_9PLAT|nr:unnamed protein product [Protopolystoma xenopodis]
MARIAALEERELAAALSKARDHNTCASLKFLSNFFSLLCIPIYLPMALFSHNMSVSLGLEQAIGEGVQKDGRKSGNIAVRAQTNVPDSESVRLVCLISSLVCAYKSREMLKIRLNNRV